MRYQVTESEQGSCKTLVLGWLRTCLKKEIDNLTTDWRDGFLLSSLVNFCDPTLIIDHLFLDSDEGFENVSNALQLAEEHLDIPQLLKPDDFVCEKPDENCIMAYLSYFYNGPESPGQRVLLDWIQAVTGTGEPFPDFADSWLDGKNLGRLVDSASAEGFKEYERMKGEDDKLKCCKLAMEAAMKLFGIRMSITPEQFSDAALNPMLRVIYILEFFLLGHYATVEGGLHIPEEGTTVWLDLSLPQGSTKEVAASAKGEIVGKVPARVQRIEDDKYRVEFDAEIPDEYSFYVSVGGMKVKGSPFMVDMTPSDKGTIELTDTMLPEKAGFPAVLTFGASTATYGKLTAEVKGERSGEVPHMIDLVTPSISKVSFIPLHSETYTVDVLFNGVHIVGSPFSYSLDDLIQPEMVKVGKPVKKIAGEIVTVSVDTSAAGKDTLKAKCTGKDIGEVEVFYSPREDPNEIYFTPTIEGHYKLNVYYGSTEVMGSPFYIAISNDPPNAKNVRLSQPPSGSMNIGSEIKVGFDTSKAGGGDMEVSCTGKNAGSIEVGVVEKPDQIYELTFTPSESDIYTIEVQWGGEAVPGSPFNLNLIPRDAPDPTKCKVIDFPNSATILLTHEPITFMVDTRVAGNGYLDIVTHIEYEDMDYDRISIASTGTRGSEVTNMELQHEMDDNLEPIHEERGESREASRGGASRSEGEAHVEEGNKRKVEETRTTSKTEGNAEKNDEAVPEGDTSKTASQDREESEDHHSKDKSEESEVAEPQLIIEPSEDDPKIYHITYVPVQEGTHSMSLYWSDMTITGSPLSFNIHAPQQAEYNDPVSITIKTSYKRKNLKVKLQKRDGTVVKHNVKMEKITTGNYVLIFTPTQPDIYVVNVSAKGRPIRGSPYVVNYFKPEISDERLLDVQVNLPTSSVMVGDPVTLSIQVPEQVWVEDISAVVRKPPSSEEDGDTAAMAEGPAEVLALRTSKKLPCIATATFTPEDVGEEDIEIKIRGKPLPRSPFHISIVDVIPGPQPEVVLGSMLEPGMRSGTGSHSEQDMRSRTASEQGILSGTTSDMLSPTSEAPPSVLTEDPLLLAGAIDSIFNLGLDEHTFIVDSPSKFKIFCAELGEGQLECLSKPSTNAETEVTEDTEEEEENVFWITITPKKPGKTTLMLRYGGNDILGSPFNVNFLSQAIAKKCHIINSSDCPPITDEKKKLFCVSTKGAGKGKITASARSISTKKRVNVKTSLHSKNHYHIILSMTEGYNYLFTVKFDGLDIDGSPYRILLGNPSLCKAEGDGLSKGWVGLKNEFLVKSVDAGPGELSVFFEKDEISEEEEELHRIRPNISKINDFLYKVSYRCSIAGLYWVTVKWANTNIPGSPYRIKSIKPLVASQFSFANAVPITHREKRAEFQVDVDYIIEEDDKMVAFVTKEEEEGEGEERRNCEVTRTSNTSYVISFITPELGDYSVSVQWAGEHIKGSPYRVSSIPPPAASEFSVKAVEGELSILIVNVTGPKYSFRYGDLSSSVQSNSGTSEEVQATISPVSDEESTVHFTPPAGGEYQLSILYDSDHIHGSPFQLISTDGSQCYHKGKGLVSAAVNQPNSFSVFTENAGHGDLKVDIETEVDNEGDIRLIPDVVTRNNTIYDVTYTPNFTGYYKISVTWDIHEIPGSPFNVVCCDPTRYTVFNMETNWALGTACKFGVREATMGPTYEELTVFARDKDRKIQHGMVNRGDDGNYMCVVEPPVLGKHVVHIQCNGHDITGSPFKIQIHPAPDPEKVIVSGSGVKDGLVGQKGMFDIDVTNAGYGFVNLKVRGPKSGFNVNLTNGGERHKILAEYNPAQAGKYFVSVLWSGEHVKNSPFCIHIREESRPPRTAVTEPITLKSVG